jgi:hypothetical protein
LSIVLRLLRYREHIANNKDTSTTISIKKSQSNQLQLVKSIRNAASRVVLMDPLRKEYASLMVQLGNDVATRGVPTKLLREEFVSLMEQPRNDATLRGVPIKLLREEFV